MKNALVDMFGNVRQAGDEYRIVQLVHNYTRNVINEVTSITALKHEIFN